MAGRERGFTYLGLIVTVAIIGLVGAATLKVDALLHRAAAEQELLEIGAAFSEALRSYADATPRGQPQLPPPSLQALLKDPRYPGVRRHLRKIFVDPMTGKTAWGIVYVNNPNGVSSGAGSGAGSSGMGRDTGGTGVLAVYSLSQARPLKVANFDARFQNFENKEHISDWKFAASGQALAQPGQLLAGQAAPGQTAPGQTAPGQTAPGQTVPGQPAASLFAPPPGQGTSQPTQPTQSGPANPPSLFRNAPPPLSQPQPPPPQSGQTPADPAQEAPQGSQGANDAPDSLERQDAAHAPPATASDSN